MMELICISTCTETYLEAGTVMLHTWVHINTEMAGNSFSLLAACTSIHFLTAANWAPGDINEILVIMFTDMSIKGVGIWLLCEHARWHQSHHTTLLAFISLASLHTLTLNWSTLTYPEFAITWNPRKNAFCGGTTVKVQYKFVN